MNLCSLTLAAVILVHAESEPFAEWMASLKQPDAPTVSCCGPADQVYVDSYEETTDGGFIAHVGDRVIKVPPYKVNWNDVNPTGRGVLFTTQGTEPFVLCFVPGSGV